MTSEPPHSGQGTDPVGVAVLLRAVTGSGFLYAANLGLAFLTSILLARLLGAEEFGLYSFPLAIVTVVGLPIHLGLASLLVRETARGLLRERMGKVEALWRWADRTIVLYSVAAATALMAMAAIAWGDAVETQVLAICLFLIPLVAISHARSAGLRGLDRPILGTMSENFVRPTLFAAALAAILTLAPSFASARNAMIVHALATAGGALFAVVMLRRVHARAGVREPASRDDVRQWQRALWPLAIIAGAQVGLQNINVSLLGLVEPAKEVGVFKVALSLSNLCLVGSAVATVVFAQKMARNHEAGDRAQLQANATHAALIALAGALPPAVVLGLFGTPVLATLYGAEFAVGAPELAILALGHVLAAACGLCVTLLNMAGHERETLRGLVVALATNLALSAALLPTYGALGIAIATAATQILWSLILLRSVHRRLAISATVAGIFRKNTLEL